MRIAGLDVAIIKKIAIVLAAGSGKRMNSTVAKQYMLLKGKPVLYYSLKVFADSDIDEIIIVTKENSIDYVQNEIVDKYNINKVKAIVAGGKERYHSVYAGLKAVEYPPIKSNPMKKLKGEYIQESMNSRKQEIGEVDEAIYIYVHDGARPFVNQAILERINDAITTNDAVIIGVPSKDTIKLVDGEGYVNDTPDRKFLWQIQTPQIFSYKLISEAYERLIENEELLLQQKISITDDAMVVEKMMDEKVKVIMGDYRNIKITTPEDFLIGENYINE